MNAISRFFSWLFGSPKPTFGITRRMTIDGIGLEKILVFAKGREATVQEMLMVTYAPCFKIEGTGEGSGFNCSTEEWNKLPGENETAAIQRIAREIAAEYPGMHVIAFAWPDSYPTIIAVIVTESAYASPFPTAEQSVVTGIKAMKD